MAKREQIRTEAGKKRMLIALEKSVGVVTAACKSAKVARTAHYQWLEADPAYKAAVDNLPEIALDFAESSLFKKIKKGDTIATIFYLKTKGKKRGYIEKSEIEHSGKVGVTLIESEPDPRDEPITD